MTPSPDELKALIFDGIGDLYHARYGRLRPGKDDRLRDSMSEENVRQFSLWIQYEALDDAVTLIGRLMRQRDDFHEDNEVLRLRVERLERRESAARDERDEAVRLRFDEVTARETRIADLVGERDRLIERESAARKILTPLHDCDPDIREWLGMERWGEKLTGDKP